MSEKNERSLDDYEADNYRRANDGHVQPDRPVKPAETPAAVPAAAPVDEKKAV